MFQGFYNLTSGVLTQTRNLNVISNNMANASTPGYKADKYIATTFKEEMVSRMGNIDKTNNQEVGEMSKIRASSETVTDYVQGSFEETGGVLDLALKDTGFFAVQLQDGTTGYTRNGSFMLDDEGYLYAPSMGRVLGVNGPIQLGTDKVYVSSDARVVSEDGTQYFDQISIVEFNNPESLIKQSNGVYTSEEQAMNSNTEVQWKYLERSNVDAAQQMTDMMSGQRNLQSASQIMKMYDQLMGKAVTEIGRV